MRGYLSYPRMRFVGFAREQTGGGLSADSIRLALAADVPLLALLSQADRMRALIGERRLCRERRSRIHDWDGRARIA